MNNFINRFISIILKFKWLIILILVIIVGIIYKKYNPYDVNFFPKCQFYTITGYKCPGCGSQRAIHDLLNFKFYDALKENLFLVISLPYIVLGAYFDLRKNKTKREMIIYEKLFGYKTIVFIFFLIIFFWIVRNFSFYQKIWQ